MNGSAEVSHKYSEATYDHCKEYFSAFLFLWFPSSYFFKGKSANAVPV